MIAIANHELLLIVAIILFIVATVVAVVEKGWTVALIAAGLALATPFS